MPVHVGTEIIGGLAKGGSQTLIYHFLQGSDTSGTNFGVNWNLPIFQNF